MEQLIAEEQPLHAEQVRIQRRLPEWGLAGTQPVPPGQSVCLLDVRQPVHGWMGEQGVVVDAEHVQRSDAQGQGEDHPRHGAQS